MSQDHSRPELARLRFLGSSSSEGITQGTLVLASCTTAILCSLLVYYLATKKRKILLIDFECFSPPNRMFISADKLIEGTLKSGAIGTDQADFHSRVIKSSGIDDYAAFPEAVIRLQGHDGTRPFTLEENMAESKEVMFTCTEELLQKTGANPADIGIVMVCCSCFSAMPSFGAMIVNRFKMSTDVLTYSMSGMGCSSSIVCVDLAKYMLQQIPNTQCLIVSSENVTSQAYLGTDKSMCIVNCIFRVGGAATLLSNRKCDYGQAKYELTHSLRIHLAREDEAFNCMGMKEDDQGKLGTFLRKNVADIAEQGMALNMRKLAPLVLPYTELLKCARDKKYIPDFGLAFEHFLIHTGGKAILDGLQKKLALSDKQVGPSRDAYWKFGNTSVASTWYILARIEHLGLMKKGDRTWQFGAGGAFKCSTATWKARKNIKAVHKCWQ